MKRACIFPWIAVLISILACSLAPTSAQPTKSRPSPQPPGVIEGPPTEMPAPTMRPAPTISPVPSPTSSPTPEPLPSLEEISARYDAEISSQIERIRTAQPAPPDFVIPSSADSQIHFLPLEKRQYQVQYLLFRERVFGNLEGEPRFYITYSYAREGCLSWFGLGCTTQGVKVTGRLYVETGNAIYQIEELPSYAVGAGAHSEAQMVEMAVYPFESLGDQNIEIERLMEILIGFASGYDPIDAISIYGQPDTPTRVEILRLTLASPNWPDRKAAAASIADLGSEAASLVPELLLALEDKESLVRSRAIDALGAIGPEAVEAVPALVSMLKKNYADCSIINALGNIGPGAVAGVPAIMVSLGDESKYVRQCACHALGKMGPAASEAVPALITALRDSEADVRMYAAQALRAITGENFGQDADAWQNWWDANQP